MSPAAARTVRAGRHTVAVHRPDTVLFPAEGASDRVTKGDLVEYYRSAAPYLLPHPRAAR